LKEEEQKDVSWILSWRDAWHGRDGNGR